MKVANNYSLSERVLHRLVLGSPTIQEISFDIQQFLMPRGLESKNPIFLVGMPRSGTTILLNLLVTTGEFESQRYRDIPFPLCSRAWAAVRKNLSITPNVQDRFHNDGITISADAPEAFEEIFWYNMQGRVSESKLRSNFIRYMTSVVSGSGSNKRYVSKNNGNWVRLGFLEDICKQLGGKVVIILRSPLHVALSSLKLHTYFSELQGKNPFMLEYMNLVRHREFGHGLSWLELPGGAFKTRYSPNSLECWLEYWIYLHSSLAQRDLDLYHLVDYDHLINDPICELRRMFSRCSVRTNPDSVASIIKSNINSEIPYAQNDRVAELVVIAEKLKDSLLERRWL